VEIPKASPEEIEARFREMTSFFAKLASIASLRSLREGERLLLEEDARRLLYPWLNDLAPVIVTRRGPRRELWSQKTKASPSKPARNPSALFLNDVHDLARTWICPLADAQEVFPDPDKLPTTVWSVKNGEFSQGWRPDPARRGPEWALISTFRHRKFFPYARCPTCRNVFVRRVKRQKYCSPNCTYLGSESSRKEKKREYMKKYMAERRARERRTEGRQKPKKSTPEKA
jgi:hypothetical protein